MITVKPQLASPFCVLQENGSGLEVLQLYMHKKRTEKRRGRGWTKVRIDNDDDKRLGAES